MMACNPCGDRPCPHCDSPCNDPDCRTCRRIAYMRAAGAAVIATRPQPADHELHDLRPHTDPVTDGVRVGAVGRCQHCGGLTYQLPDGPWCPRAGCTGTSP